MLTHWARPKEEEVVAGPAEQVAWAQVGWKRRPGPARSEQAGCGLCLGGGGSGPHRPGLEGGSATGEEAGAARPRLGPRRRRRWLSSRGGLGRRGRCAGRLEREAAHAAGQLALGSLAARG